MIATATIAPLAGINTLGDPIINVSGYGDAGRLGAAIVVAALAVLRSWPSARSARRDARGLKLEPDTASRRTRPRFQEEGSDST